MTIVTEIILPITKSSTLVEFFKDVFFKTLTWCVCTYLWVTVCTCTGGQMLWATPRGTGNGTCVLFTSNPHLSHLLLSRNLYLTFYAAMPIPFIPLFSNHCIIFICSTVLFSSNLQISLNAFPYNFPFNSGFWH